MNKTLLEKLICPVSGAVLKSCGNILVSTDPKTRLSYPVKNGVPVLLAEEGKILSEAEWLKAIDSDESKRK